MNALTEETFLEYYNQATCESSAHIDGHIDWLTGTEDGTDHTDKHSDCDLL